MTPEFHLIIVLVAYLAAVVGITYLAEKRENNMPKQNELTALLTRIAAGVDRLIANESASTPDSAIQPILDAGTALAEKLDAAAPPTPAPGA